jgi:glyoxylase-like metal-dependent hydrolase (beta-lactamase superfamily II)
MFVSNNRLISTANLVLRALLLLAVGSVARASALELEVTQVSPRVYSAIGETQPPSYENAGHNNNLSFIVADDGVVVVNGGDNYLLAAALHRSIREVTDLPVRWVINENGQGHAFLGNSYWHAQGVPVIAHEAAKTEIEAHGHVALRRMQERNREKADGTTVVAPDETFIDRRSFDLGAVRIELIAFGEAHSPGDISVWLPDQKVLIAGDIAFHQRLLGVFPDTNVQAWILSFEAMAKLEPEMVVPGHGAPTDLATITRETYDYLVYLTDQVAQILDADGDLSDAYAIDQSAYAHLDTFDELAVKNAGRVFQRMELEYF